MDRAIGDLVDADVLIEGERIVAVARGLEAAEFAMRPIHEPLGSVVFQATTRDVSTVLIAGKIMKQAGKLVGVDSESLATQAERSAREILDRVREEGATLPAVRH